MRAAELAKNNGMNEKEFGQRIDEFFVDVKAGKNEEYNLACQQGSAKKANVQSRLSCMSRIL
jgi:pyruvate-formate lyase-activating enzyme